MQLLALALCHAAAHAVCPPLATPPASAEVFAFDPPAGVAGWQQVLGLEPRPTTIASFPALTAELVCAAHAAGVRAVFCVDFDHAQITNASARTAWVESWVNEAAAVGADGFNVDIEGLPGHKDDLTSLVTELRDTARKQNPHAQVSFDVSWTAQAETSGYDYAALGQALDFLVPMDYDEIDTSQGSANSPLAHIGAGIASYEKVGVPAGKLVIGLPWYGYDFPCTTPDRWAHCKVAPGGKWPGKATQVVYTAANATAVRFGSKLDAASMTVYTDYVKNGTRHQLWFDNPETLGVKYEKAAALGARGLAMWTAGSVEYSQPQGQDMWRAMGRFRRPAQVLV